MEGQHTCVGSYDLFLQAPVFGALALKKKVVRTVLNLEKITSCSLADVIDEDVQN